MVGNIVTILMMCFTALLVAVAVRHSSEEVRIEGGRILWFVDGNLKATVETFDQLYLKRHDRI